jgi:beta-galactosidase
MNRLVLCFLLMVSQVHAQERQVILLDKGWQFTRQDLQKAASSDLDDNDGETVTIPHDWAIKGPFDKMIDAPTVTVTEDGEKKPALRTVRSGSLPWIGVGWYRKKLPIPANAKGKRVFIKCAVKPIHRLSVNGM